MTDERQRDDEINRFWNALIHRGDTPVMGNLKPDQAETVRRLHGMTQASPPASAQAQVDRALSPHIAAHPITRAANGHTPANLARTRVFVLGPAWNDPGTPPLPESPPPAHPEHLPGRARRISFRAAAALLLLATLGLGVLSMGPGRSLLQQQTLLSALPSVAPREALLEITLPAEALPHGARSFASLANYSLAAGGETAWEASAGSCCPGFRFIYLLEGSLAIRPAGGAHLLRTGLNLSPEAVRAGSDVVLSAGDGIMFRWEEAFSSRNPATNEARFLEVSFIEGFSPLITAPSGWEWIPSGDVAYALSIPDRPATLRLEKVVLEPGVILLPPPDAITQLGITTADNEPLRVQETDEIENINDWPVMVHVATLVPAGGQPLDATNVETLQTLFATTLPGEFVPGTKHTVQNADFDSAPGERVGGLLSHVGAWRLDAFPIIND